jgi:MSHA biogenesis protein MshQ
MIRVIQALLWLTLGTYSHIIYAAEPISLGVCSDTFVDGLTNSSNSGIIKFEHDSQLLGNPDTVLASTSVIWGNVDNSVNTCDSANCTAEGTTVPALANNYIGYSSGTNFEADGNTKTVLTNDYKDVKVKGGGTLNMSAAFDSYHFKKLKVEDGTLNLTAGDYYIEEFEVKSGGVVNITGSGTARLWVKNKVKFKESSVVNGGINGDPAKLFVYFFADDGDKLTVESSATIAAFIYSENKIEVKSEDARVVGGMSAVGKIKVKDGSKVTFKASAISTTDFGVACTNELPSVDHYEVLLHPSAATCTASPVTIKACANADCSTLASDAVNINFQGDGITKKPLTFTGSTSFAYDHVSVGTLQLTIDSLVDGAANPLVCYNLLTNSVTSCQTVFTSDACDGSCLAYFPDAIQGNQADSTVVFANNGKLISDSDSLLLFPNLTIDVSVQPNHLTCNTSNCSVTQASATALSLPSFLTSTATYDVVQSTGAHSIGVGTANAVTDIDDLTISGDAEVTFLASYNPYLIDTGVVSGWDADLTFNSGTYWFENLTIATGAHIFVNGAVTIYVAENLLISDYTEINILGDAKDLVIVGYKNITITGSTNGATKINAVLYSPADIAIKDQVKLTGVISAGGTLTIDNDATVTFADVTDVQVGEVCGVPPLVLDHYEIVHDSTGATCDAEPVTVKACADANCTALFDDAVTTNFQGNGVTKAPLTFTGSTSFSYSETNAGTLNLSLESFVDHGNTPLVCRSSIDNSVTSCETVFSSDTCPALDHYEIVHDSIGSICAAEATTVKACANADCSVLFADAVTVNFKGNGITKAPLSFSGSTSFSYDHLVEETLQLTVDSLVDPGANSLVCRSSIDNSVISCATVFSADTCPAVLDHYEIVHDSTGSICAAEATTVKACSNADCSELFPDAVTVNFKGNGITKAPLSFTGSTSFSYDHLVEETLQLTLDSLVDPGANSLVCRDSSDNSTTSCQTVFSSDTCPAVVPTLNYQFDQCLYTGDKIIDQQGNFDGSVSGSPFSVSNAVINGALNLSATDTNDWVSVPNTAVDGLSDFTFSIWLNTSTSKDQQQIFHALGSDANDDELEVHLSDNNKVMVKIQDIERELNSGINLTDGNWHHLAITRVADEVCLLVDGAAQECETGVGSGTLSVPSSNAVVIGQEQDVFSGDFSASQSFVGLLDEFKLYDEKLLDSQINKLYNYELSGVNYDGSTRAAVNCGVAIVDYRFDECSYTGSGNEVLDQASSLHGSINGVSGSVSNAVNNGALDLSATDTSDWLSVPNTVVDGLNDFTFSIWLNTSTSNSQQTIFQALGEDENDDELEIHLKNNNIIVVKIQDLEQELSSGISLSDGQWHHFAVTRVNDQVCLLVDGAAQACVTGVGAGMLSVPTSNAVVIGQEQDDFGASFSASQSFIGLLDEFKIYLTKLTDTEIATVYANELAKLNHDGSTRAVVDCGVARIDYRFDQCTYTGSGNEVIDQSGTYNGSINGVLAAASNAAINNALDLSALDTSDWVSVPNTAVDGLNNFTFSIWINTSTTKDQQEIFHALGSNTSDDELEIHLSDNNKVMVKVQDTERELNSGTTLTNGLWHHLAVTRVNDQICLFVDGAAQECETGVGSGTLSVPTSNAVVIGQEQDSFSGTFSADQSFIGLLDEFKIYTVKLSNTEIAEVYTNEFAKLNYDGSTRAVVSCNASIKYFHITHDSFGLTCDAETVTITACNNTYDGSSCEQSTEAVELTLRVADNANVNPDVTKTVTTVNGAATVSFNYLLTDEVTFSLDAIDPLPLICNDNASESCEMLFEDAGFRFIYEEEPSEVEPNQVISNQIAGVPFSVKLWLQAVKNDKGVCVGLFNSGVAVDVSLAQQNINPGGTTGLNFKINGTDGDVIGKDDDFTSNLGLTFDSDSKAIIPAPVYLDAGEIRLLASYNLGGVNLVGSSNDFWVSPANLVVTAKLGTTVLNTTTTSGDPTHKAGAMFDLVVTAQNALGQTTLNYQPGDIEFALTRTGPGAGGVNGDFTYTSGQNAIVSQYPLAPAQAIFEDVTLATFINGSSTNAAKYSEVGLLQLALQDNGYGDDDIDVFAQAINIGRFTPDHFTLMASDVGNACGTASYMDQPALTLTYSIEAKNVDGVKTANYFGDYIHAQVSLVAENNNQGDLSNRLSGYAGSWAQGTYSSNIDVGMFTRSAAVDGPYEQLLFGIKLVDGESANNAMLQGLNMNAIETTDCINEGNCDAISLSLTLSQIRFGRLVIDNSFGPETVNLPQPMQVEYFQGGEYLLANDNCTAVTLLNMTLTPADVAVGGANDIFNAGQNETLFITAPGAGVLSTFEVEYDTFDWLKFDWNGDGFFDNNPTATATFGVYRGNDRIIYWREVVN